MSKGKKVITTANQDLTIKGNDGKTVYQNKGGSVVVSDGATMTLTGNGIIEVTSPNMKLYEDINVDALGDSLDY